MKSSSDREEIKFYLKVRIVIRDEHPQYAYIEFWFGETPPEYLPEKWYWESDGHMEYEYAQTNLRTLQEEIVEVMQELKLWADGLPEL